MSSLQGILRVASDKSMTHRAIIMSCIAGGKITIRNPLLAEDTIATKNIFQGFGVSFIEGDNTLKIISPGINSFSEPQQPLNAMNSGTTARLLLGALAKLPYAYELIGDASLSSRPMARIQKPLTQMGMSIKLTNENYLPAIISPSKHLVGIDYQMPVASAQLKSAILLAAINAKQPTKITEPKASRNHTELMLQTFNINVKNNNNVITVNGEQTLLAPPVIQIPADISQAAFFIVAALLLPNSDITLTDVGINPTRTGILDVLKTAGAYVTTHKRRHFGLEPVADIRVRYTPNLKSFSIGGELVPRLIDELPILALLALKTSGTTKIFDAAELKVKETNRITETVHLLTTLGGKALETGDGMIITGCTDLELAANIPLDPKGDHRLAMLLIVADLIAKKPLTITDLSSLSVSYPHFKDDLNALLK